MQAAGYAEGSALNSRLRAFRYQISKFFSFRTSIAAKQGVGKHSENTITLSLQS